jgi:hypothetical protein
MTKLLNITLILAISCTLFSCNNNTETISNTTESATITHNVSDNEMVGNWTLEDINLDVKLTTDIPGAETLIKNEFNKKIKEDIGKFVITYNSDGTFSTQGANETATGKYSIVNNELLHSNFSNEESMIAYASAHVDGAKLTLQISGNQFWKMLDSASFGKQIEMVKKTLVVNNITYIFKKQ